jgi:hypothetical protein
VNDVALFGIFQWACLELNNAAPSGYGDGVSAVAGAKLLHDVFHVRFHSLFRDEKLVGNVPIAISAGGLP